MSKNVLNTCLVALVMIGVLTSCGGGPSADVKEFVQGEVKGNGNAEIQAYHPLKVTAQKEGQGVTEAWCVDIKFGPTEADRIGMIVFRQNGLRRLPDLLTPPNCGSIETY